MIFFYPMLTSASVSKNITLAICKTLEKYLLIYETDRVLNLINAKLPKSSRVVTHGRGFYLKESLEEIQEQGGKGKGKGKPDPEDDDDDDDDDDKNVKPVKGAKIDMPFKDAFSIEPTYMQIETEQHGKEIIGIKVIPYPVKSEGDLVELLLNDRYAPLLVKWLRMYYRFVIRTAWGIMHGLRYIPFLSRRPVTGKATVDIIHAGSKHDKNMFVLLNQSEIENSDFLNEPKNVLRLFRQGWSSFVVADDVNQRATFCMKKFISAGFCTEVNYSYLLASIGKEKLQIYNDLEDLQKKASPFFRLKKPKKKIFEGCCNKTNKNVATERQLILEDITTKDKKDILTERQIVLEDLKSFMGTMSKDKVNDIFKSVQKRIKNKDKDGIKKDLSKIPKVSLPILEKISSKLSPNFNSAYKTTQKVLENSTKLPDKLIKPLAIFLAVKSTYKVDNYKPELKKNLFEAVQQVRKSQQDGGPPIYKFTFTVIGTILAAIFYSVGIPALMVGVIGLLVMVWIS